MEKIHLRREIEGNYYLLSVISKKRKECQNRYDNQWKKKYNFASIKYGYGHPSANSCSYKLFFFVLTVTL